MRTAHFSPQQSFCFFAQQEDEEQDLQQLSLCFTLRTTAKTIIAATIIPTIKSAIFIPKIILFQKVTLSIL